MDELKRKHLETRLREMLQRLKKIQKPDQTEKQLPNPPDGSNVIRRRRGKPDKHIAADKKKSG